MRDIREDLKERLKETGQERSQFQQRLDKLIEKESTLREMLDIEERRWATQEPLPGLEVNGTRPRTTSTLGIFIMKTLADGKSQTLQVITQKAMENGFDFGDKAPGRVLHFALVGMRQNQMVERIKGRWRRKN